MNKEELNLNSLDLALKDELKSSIEEIKYLMKDIDCLEEDSAMVVAAMKHVMF